MFVGDASEGPNGRGSITRRDATCKSLLEKVQVSTNFCFNLPTFAWQGDFVPVDRLGTANHESCRLVSVAAGASSKIYF